MPKFLIFSDPHIGIRNEENLKSLLWIADLGRELQVDQFLCPGDFFDRRATEQDFWVATEFLKSLHTGIMILKGNHGTSQALDVLNNTGSIQFIDGPSISKLHGATIYSLPHVDKAYINECKEFVGVTGSQIEFNEAVKTVFEYFKADAEKTTGPKIFLGHLNVNGSVTSTGQELNDPGLSQGFNIPLSYITDLNISCAAVGHIHKAQILTERPCLIFIPGSHSRHNHGEMEAKGAWLVELDEESGRLLTYKFFENPHAPKLITDYWQWNEEAKEWDFISEEEDIKQAEVRIIAQYREGAKPDFTDLTKTYEGFCRLWKLEKRLQVVDKIRSIEIVQAVSPEEKLKAYWVLKGEPPKDDQPGILSKLADILERVQ